jgi:hypothetical protein
MNAVERKILASAANLDHDPECPPRLPDVLPLDTDMERLVNTALKEGLGGFLYRRFQKSDTLGRLKRGQTEKLENHYYQTVRTNLKLLRELKEVLHRTNQGNTPVVLLQGIQLILEVYEDVGLRPMTDIDLWVLKKNYASLADIMTGLGYERNPLYPDTFRKGSTTVDVHTHLLWADRIRSRRFLFASTDEEVFHRCRVVDVEGEAGRCLSQYDQVLYLGLHALKHRFERLVWLVDIKNIVSRWAASDWKTLHDRAIEFGQGKIPSYVLFLLSHLFDYAPSKAAPWTPERRVSLIERRALMGRVKGDALPLWAPLFLFSSGGSPGTRLCFILETLFPRPQVLRQVFPSPLGAKPWKLYVRRIFQILQMSYLTLRKNTRH